MSISFEISRNPDLLGQYYQLRDTYFKRDLKIPDFDGSEDPYDREARILLAHRKGECIAGARIRQGLPMAKQLREFGASPQDSCLWERFVMHPSARNMALGRDFCSALIDVSRNLGFQHALVLSTLRISRLYRMCHAGLGVDFKIQRAAPECAEGALAKLDHYLSIAHLYQAEESSSFMPVSSNADTHQEPALALLG